MVGLVLSLVVFLVSITVLLVFLSLFWPIGASAWNVWIVKSLLVRATRQTVCDLTKLDSVNISQKYGTRKSAEVWLSYYFLSLF